MKSQIVKLESKKDLDFPKLMIGSASRVIVLFHESGKGQIVNGKSYSYGLGNYNIEWHMDSFTDYNGTINLSNK